MINKTDNLILHGLSTVSSKYKWLQIILVLLIMAVVAMILVYLLLGGKACISHLSAVKPQVETKYRFGDLNVKHLTYAKRIGIQPLEDENEIDDVTDRLQKVNTCNYYFIRQGAHSHPYLVKEGAQLLKDIGKEFQQQLSSKGYHPHMIVVTSLLRTKSDVKRLMKVNRVAISNSAHLNGTTFDISYARYAPWIGHGKVPSRTELARILGETLHKLRRQGRCCVKYEDSTNCYHITVRK